MKLEKLYLDCKKMKFFLKIIIIGVFFIGSDIANANTLLDSLQSAYLNNPKLNAERANMRASKEEKREAVSEFLPSVTISGYRSEQDNTKGKSSDSNFEPQENSMLIEQKIFQGFGGVANLQKKRKGQKLGEFKLKKIEQEILLEAAKVHTEFLLNVKKVDINLTNIELLERQVETDQNRLEKGEISLTDLAQSEASLAGARAELIAAENDLITSKANFEKIIGKKPTNNIKKVANINLNLPTSLAEAYKISNSENPNLRIAELEYEQSKLDVTIAGSELSPSATLSYKIAEQDNLSSTVQERTQQTVTATATWPLFAGGKNAFNYRKFQEIKNQKELLFEDEKKNSSNRSS
jgi:outer membrane protein